MQKIISALFLCAIALPAIAGPVQFVTLRDDLVTPLSVGVNRPTHIKAPRGFKFYKGWLDNNLIADVDSDRPFQSGASMVYLVGRTKGRATLTLVGKDSVGEEKLMVFKIATVNSGGPDIVSLRLQGGSTDAKTLKFTPVSVLRSGLDSAVSAGRLVPDSRLYGAIIKFIQLVESGKTAQQASEMLGLDLAVVTEILKMGKKDLPAPVISPVLPLPPVSVTQIPAPSLAPPPAPVILNISKSNRNILPKKKSIKLAKNRLRRIVAPSPAPEPVPVKTEKYKSPSQRALEDLQKSPSFHLLRRNCCSSPLWEGIKL
jgi:hypothetical protein